MNRIALRSSLSTLRAGFSQLRAGLGLGPVKATTGTVRSPISDFTPIMWGGRRLSPDQLASPDQPEGSRTRRTADVASLRLHSADNKPAKLNYFNAL